MSTLVEPVPAPIANALAQVPLVEDTYALRVEEEDLKFMRAQTGITDDIELKRHILQVQAEAYRVRLCYDSAHATVADRLMWPQVFPYPCIRRFVFVR